MNKRIKQDTTKRKPVYTATGIALGAGLGLVASLLFFDNLALSLIFGAAVGLVIGQPAVSPAASGSVWASLRRKSTTRIC